MGLIFMKVCGDFLKIIFEIGSVTHRYTLMNIIEWMRNDRVDSFLLFPIVTYTCVSNLRVF